jgi:LPPG:FO 2-phospho-L-lactate transferase
MGIKHPVLPMSDNQVRTIVSTKEHGELPFQEYFVKFQCQPTMIGCSFLGIENASFSVQGKEAIEEAEIIVICPSNPWVSIDPILEIQNIRQLLSEKLTVAVSPIIGGKTIKGPAAKMYQEMGIDPSALAVAKHYKGVIKGIVIDNIDKNLVQPINQCGIIPFATQTIMSDNQTRVTLARETILFTDRLKKV